MLAAAYLREVQSLVSGRFGSASDAVSKEVF
jgi:hypothetical protein